MIMRHLLLLTAIIVLGFCRTEAQEELATAEELQDWINMNKETTRAKTGDIVYLVMATVKDADKSRFEKWTNEILYAALYKSNNPMKKAQLNATRWLEPLQKNMDESWTYCWIMDPAIPKTIYDIPLFLTQEYGEMKGKKYFEEYQGMVEEKVFAFKQTGK